ncbi:hypothetical protein [Ensifer adhaerens]|uniref:hypothetical protein n=1 Tax=Ensifer adhaerens TaxID=106592 RepID=UPI001446F208|nr:hypothetical protein [Ensifer adhaerens]MDF8353217.1 hypothetical protein [Ensifer adhaerens]
MGERLNPIIAADLKQFGGSVRDLRLALWIARAASSQSKTITPANDNIRTQ